MHFHLEPGHIWFAECAFVLCGLKIWESWGQLSGFPETIWNQYIYSCHNPPLTGTGPKLPYDWYGPKVPNCMSGASNDQRNEINFGVAGTQRISIKPHGRASDFRSIHLKETNQNIKTIYTFCSILQQPKDCPKRFYLSWKPKPTHDGQRPMVWRCDICPSIHPSGCPWMTFLTPQPL